MNTVGWCCANASSVRCNRRHARSTEAATILQNAIAIQLFSIYVGVINAKEKKRIMSIYREQGM